jgi:hypothetical protein
MQVHLTIKVADHVKKRGTSGKWNNGPKSISPGVKIHTLYNYDNLKCRTDNCVAGRK